MPSSPSASPENTLVTMNASPCTVPTRPLALACRSVGTSRVTVVDSAMLRMFSTTAPSSTMAANTQNHGCPRSTSVDSGNSRYRMPATRNAARVARLDTTMTRCLRWRSTRVPNGIAKRATNSMYAPPMMPVASTDRVSR